MLLRDFFFALFLIAVTVAACAADAVPAAEDPALEAQVTRISENLRCLVCQNQTIADSHAELAVDLKNEVRDMVRQGKSEADIIDFMVARYGDFVLYKPPVRTTTWLLWFGPFALLGIGLIALFVKLRRRGAPSPALDEAAQARARALLAEIDAKEQA